MAATWHPRSPWPQWIVRWRWHPPGPMMTSCPLISLDSPTDEYSWTRCIYPMKWHRLPCFEEVKWGSIWILTTRTWEHHSILIRPWPIHLCHQKRVIYHRSLNELTCSATHKLIVVPKYGCIPERMQLLPLMMDHETEHNGEQRNLS